MTNAECEAQSVQVTRKPDWASRERGEGFSSRLATWTRTLSHAALFNRSKAEKMRVCRIVLLDQQNFETEVPKSALGSTLFEQVKQKLDVQEADYFGLSYRNSSNLRFWLNLDKRIDKQVESVKAKDMVFYWEVKFYPPAPEQLNEDLTRYLLVLQLRKDILEERLPASFQTLAVLGSYTAQGEIGEIEKSTLELDIDYLRQHLFAPRQSDELLIRIKDLHKTRKGLTPAEADQFFLENAKKMSMYGMDLYPVKDSSNREVFVGVCAGGLHVYHGRLRMESFKWPQILKISYKTTVFHIKVRPGEYEKHQKTLGFRLPSLKLAKRLWRIAVENHQFFRLQQPEPTDTGTLRGFGSRRWRLSGRTQAQLRNVGSPRRSFSRTNSIMSSDTFPGLNQSTSTMPIPAHRKHDKELDPNKNYHTYSEIPLPYSSAAARSDDPDLNHLMEEMGREPRATDRYDMSYDSGEYLPNDDVLDDSAHASKAADPQSCRTPPSTRSRDGEPPYPTTDNLINGGHETDAREPEVVPIHSDSTAQAPTGLSRSPRVPERKQSAPYSPSSQPPTTNGSLSRSSSKDVSKSRESLPRDPAARKTPNRGGVGDLPMPCFSLESAGVMPTGAIDNSVKLSTSDRAEKVIKIGVPPTVKTTSLKFSGSSEPTTTHSTWSPPTVQTEKKHFNYTHETNGYMSRKGRVSETTTFSAERDGYKETRVKHTITVTGDDELSDQLLLDAIQTVTGLDKNLGVDRIEIKTEESG